jgi:hypothetical protein
MSDDWTTGLLPYDADANDLPPTATLGEFLYLGQAYTPEAFDRYVQQYDVGSVKPDFIVLHHTAVPSASWARFPSGAVWDAGEEGVDGDAILTKRLRQVESIRNYYRDSLGWDRGPHLFIDDRAIYTFSPMREVGIHAAQGNSYTEHGRLHYSIGIEVVGCYTSVRWPEPVLRNVASAVCSLRAALGTFEFVSGPRAGQIAEHRMFNKPSCPGDAIRPAFYMPHFEAAWAARSGIDPGTQERRADISSASPLLAPPRATVEQALAYLRERPHGEYSDDDLGRVILPAYWQIATSVGLDPLLAVAQLLRETDNLTSFWAARPQRNPAGIGVTGRTSPTRPAEGAWAERDGVWLEGISFASWEKESIPAHLGRLLAYALRDDQAAPEQRALIARALQVRPLPPDYRGAAPTLAGLEGRWSRAAGYADAIAAIARKIAAR